MDIDVARWVLEFLIRQSVDDRVINALVRVLPLSNDDSSLKKAMLLRRIESQIAKCLVSEKIIGLLEFIEELDYENGVSASEAMKRAYCAVAVHCVVRFLDERDEKEGKYFDAVKRIWRGRVWKMEESENAGLGSDELRNWNDEIEAAVWDPSVCENVRVRSRGIDALGEVREYVAEAWESMGPSFLESVVGTVSDETMREVLGVGSDRNHSGVGERAASLPDSCPDSIFSSANKVTQRRRVLPRRKHVAVKCARGVTSGTSTGAKLTDMEDLAVRISSTNYGCLSSPEINKVQEALRTSSLELQAVVQDPLPDAIQLAENVISSMRRDSGNQGPSVEKPHGTDVDAPNPSARQMTEAAQANEAILNNQCCRQQNNVPKPSLMERNGTAHTYEWEDSGTLPERSPNCGTRLHLLTPSLRVVSPLKKYQTTKAARRKIKRWSNLEEDTLRVGVQKYGRGNWKLILDSYRDIFEERTDVDLKDKWRNMTR